MMGLAALAGARIAHENHIIDIPIDTNSGTSSAAGLLLSGLDAAGVYQVTLPEDQVFSGYSLWPSDDSTIPPLVPANQKWGNQVILTGGPGAPVGPVSIRNTTVGVVYGYLDGPTARAAFPGITVTGYTEYVLWVYDTNPGDNRGGLSVRLSRIG